jgi:putative ABC transport system permease protein
VSAPKAIEVRDQARLGLGRCLQLALTGMSYRMFRSSVTVAILALAVAFLTHMLVFGIVERSTEVAAYGELQDQRSLGEAVTRLGAKDGRAAIIAALARRDPARLREYTAWASSEPSVLERAARTAADYERAQVALDKLPIAARAVVLGDRAPDELLAAIRDEAALERLLRQHADFALRPPLGSAAALRALVIDELPRLEELLGRIADGHARAIAALADAYPEKAPRELVQSPPPDFAEGLRTAGFVLDVDLGRLSAFARRQADIELLGKLVLSQNARAQIARAVDIPLGDVDFEVVAEYVAGSGKRVAWLARVLAESGAPAHVSAARLEQLVSSFLRQREVERAAGAEPPGAAGFLGISGRSRWLVALSFLVCIVGVANAMLMSVTERFTEIATMKCLGALDGFVMAMFVFEAMIQGLIGGVVGLMLGALLAVLRGAVEYGTLLVVGDAFADVLSALAVSLAAGVVLAAAAAVGPSFVAARLAPMEAMRVD